MRPATVICLVLLLCVALTSVGRAQVDTARSAAPVNAAPVPSAVQHEPLPAEPARSAPRMVGEHQFMYNAAVPDMFPNTYLMNEIAVGMAVGLEVPVYTREDPPRLVGTLGGELLYAGLRFAYQYGITDWLGARVSFGVTSRLGTNGATLIAQGVNAATTPELAVVARAWRGESAQLSVVALYSTSALTYVTPLTWARSIIDSLREGAPLDSNNTLVSDAEDMRLNLGVRYAYAFSPAFGVAAGGSFAISSLSAKLTTLFGVTTAGISGECDFGKITPVDVGLLVGMTYTSRSAINEDIAAGTIGTRISILYTGRQDLSTGVNLAFASLQSRQSDASFSMQIASIFMRYDF